MAWLLAWLKGLKSVGPEGWEVDVVVWGFRFISISSENPCRSRTGTGRGRRFLFGLLDVIGLLGFLLGFSM